MTMGHHLVPIDRVAEDCPGEPPCGFMVRGPQGPWGRMALDNWEIPTCSVVQYRTQKKEHHGQTVSNRFWFAGLDQ